MASHFSYSTLPILHSTDLCEEIQNPDYDPTGSSIPPSAGGNYGHDPLVQFIYKPLKNTDGSEYDSNNLRQNDWCTNLKNIKVDAAMDDLSSFAIYFKVYYYGYGDAELILYELDTNPSAYPEIEVYKLAESDINFLNCNRYIGYNFSSGNLTLTIMPRELSIEQSIQNFSFDSGAAEINDFFRIMGNQGFSLRVPSKYSSSETQRELNTYISRSFCGTWMTMTSNGWRERKYVGSAIDVKQINQLDLTKFTKALSMFPSDCLDINCMAMTAIARDGEPLGTLRSVEFEGL